MKTWKNVYNASSNQNSAGVFLPTTDKIDFKTKLVTKDKEGFNADTVLIPQEDTTKLPIYANI